MSSAPRLKDLGCCVCLLFISATLHIARGEEKADDKGGVFFAVEGAKDCALDERRQRLYVTTPATLFAFDVKERAAVESIDLLGDLQACDITPDFNHLAVGPVNAQLLYWIKLGDQLEINQIQFQAPAPESGVWALGIGFDNTVLFSMTYKGSGGVGLRRFKPTDNSVELVGKISMDSAISPSGDRQLAAIAEGNISSGPLQVYDFKQQRLEPIANLSRFHYEIACSQGAQYFASPHNQGCDLFNKSGGKLGNLTGKAVICAAFHPKNDALFVMRHDESSIQEYDVQGKLIANAYQLEQAQKIVGNFKSRVVADVNSVGPRSSITFRRITSGSYKGFRSGRLRVSESGNQLMAVVPSGVYVFPIKSRPASSEPAAKPRINVIDARSSEGK